MKAKELKELTREELTQKLAGLREELFNLGRSRYTTKLEKPHRIKQTRKDIARILTILKERKEDNVAKK